MKTISSPFNFYLKRNKSPLKQGGQGTTKPARMPKEGYQAFIGVRGYHTPRLAKKGSQYPWVLGMLRRGVPPKKANFSTKLVKFLEKSQFFLEIFTVFVKFERVLENFRNKGQGTRNFLKKGVGVLKFWQKKGKMRQKYAKIGPKQSKIWTQYPRVLRHFQAQGVPPPEGTEGIRAGFVVPYPLVQL